MIRKATNSFYTLIQDGILIATSKSYIEQPRINFRDDTTQQKDDNAQKCKKNN